VLDESHMNAPLTIRRDLYPALEAYAVHRPHVDDLHTLYVEEAGNRNGLPVVLLHGGPGGGSSPDMRRFCDPAHYRMVLFDQRGCGRSLPHASLHDNTTWDLVADMERIRLQLGIEKWLVFGGSWGSTLALAYAVTHPERVAGLVLRGIFLLTQQELSWFYEGGAANIFPESWERFVSVIPPEERTDLIGAFRKRLMSDDRGVVMTAARAWSRWEGETISIAGPAALAPRFSEDRFVEAFARIENHYFVNQGFFPENGWLLEQAGEKLQSIPTRIVHGRYDMCTPVATAWALKKRLPNAELVIVPDAGHSSLEPGIADQLVRATDAMVSRANW
jgi:proline iminopeptidase